ncbi:uncharacterized protein LOC110682971 [Chenopodium quinoa]|uniref:uncharacterized protein LOC110682971 n=1 Tax=Chenopodium quinoa TaxID=63459 RepID=UPI000B77D823|nr:uncharacterized protein LOC110682971 [Chenopodium quinoa]
MELEEDLLGLERFRRARVMININKPLRRFQRIRDKRGRVVCVEFAYERLPFFCFACGVIGHSEKDCDMVSEESKAAKLGRGRWLRASPRKGKSKEEEELSAIMAARKQLFVVKGDVASSEKLEKERELTKLKEGQGVLQLGGALVVDNVEEGAVRLSDNIEGEQEGETVLSTCLGGEQGERVSKGWKKSVRLKETYDTIMREEGSVILGKRGRDDGENVGGDGSVAKIAVDENDISGWRVAEAVLKQPRLAQ